MYHTKEVLNLVTPVIDVEPYNDNNNDFTIEGSFYPDKPAEMRYVDIKSAPIFSKIRFGELDIGEKFFYNGCWLIKTGEYAAKSDRKRDNQSYLFFKKDVVKNIKFKTMSDFFPNSQSEKEPYAKLFKEEDMFLSREDGEIEPTNFIESRVGFLDEKPRLQPKWDVIITPGFDIHRVEVVCNDGYRWEDAFTGNLDGYWRVPICLKIITLDLVYDGEEIQLYFEGKKIWCKEFTSWAGINTCSISIEDVCLDNT